MNNRHVSAVDVYAEGRRTRKYVGRLERDTDAGGQTGYRFTYNEGYLKYSKAVSLGSELPLTKRSFFSKKLFPSILDRIPSKDNPAYPDYCSVTGIDVQEDDPFVLLTSIGKRGPSCFIFEPVYEKSFSPADAIAFRKRLGLSYREFAALFDFSPYTIQKIESGKQTGRDVLKRMELYVRFPEVAWFEMKMNKPRIHSNLWQRIAGLHGPESSKGNDDSNS